MNYFGTVRQKLRRKILILLPPPPLIQTFSVPEISETLKGSFPYEIFRHCETKTFRRKILILPPPLIQTFSIPEINERLKDSPPPYGNFRHCETKNF